MAENKAIDYQALVKDSLKKIVTLKQRIEELEQPEAIAVIGMDCRFPQSEEGPDAFWELLESGKEGISELPAQRRQKNYWQNSFETEKPELASVAHQGPNPGKIITPKGGFLADMEQFAADFFHISPREAESMDPQQRMLMETHWRALEHAGIKPSSLMGSATGIFAGICGTDYYHLLASRPSAQIDSYMASGTAHSTAAGRLAFYFGSNGPAIAVDTACSSSLVALHLACQSLRNGESNLALASGVNALLSPEYSINFSVAGMLSEDGHCKTFDDTANGYVRGEGCGVVVLKRLADAQKAGDKILAVISGSAVNQDGRSSGLTAPNGSAQREVFKQALHMAGVTPQQVSYIEAHGTGTSLGDPIELEAMQAVYGQARQEPIVIGSVKSQIGHLEGAAGIAGFIKTVLMLQKQKIPAQLHFQQPNRKVDWADVNLRVADRLMDWHSDSESATGKASNPRMAAVSSFGFGGTNAHIIVAESPVMESTGIESAGMERAGIESAIPESIGLETQSIPTTGTRAGEFISLSARDEKELHQLAQHYLDYLQQKTGSNSLPFRLADFCYSVNQSRDHFEFRAATSCHSIDELQQFLQSQVHHQVQRCEDGLRIGLLFTGQGAFSGKTTDLSAISPVFAETIEYAEPLFQSLTGQSLKQLLFTSAGSTQLEDTRYAQPALFCYQMALSKFWQSLGVEIDTVMGHSVGEYAAACMAGVFEFDDALRLICRRGELMSLETQEGQMLAVLTPPDDLQKLLHEQQLKLSIAGFNGENNTVVSGARSEIERLHSILTQQSVSGVKLAVDRAFHSHLMDGILESFRRMAEKINYQIPQINLISTQTGGLVGAEIATADYWVQQIRKPVRFIQALSEWEQEGINCGLEIGPQNVLTKLAQREKGQARHWISSLPAPIERDSLGDTSTDLISPALQQLYLAGLRIDWENYYQTSLKSRTRITIPGYPYSRKAYWYTEANINQRNDVSRLHPLVHECIELAGDAKQTIFKAHLNHHEPNYHQDHRYHNKVLIPAAHYIEMVRFAVTRDDEQCCEIKGIEYLQPLMVEDNQEFELQLQLTESETAESNVIKSYQCHIYSRELNFDSDKQESPWQLHFKASANLNKSSQDRSQHRVEQLNTAIPVSELSPTDLYHAMLQRGIEFGPAYQLLTQLQCSAEQSQASINISHIPSAYGLYPPVLDACMQTVGALLPGYTENANDAQHEALDTFLQSGMDRMQIFAPLFAPFFAPRSHTVNGSMESAELTVIATRTFASQNRYSFDLDIVNAQGQLLICMQGLHLSLATPSTSHKSTQELLYSVQWLAPFAAPLAQDSMSAWLGQELNIPVVSQDLPSHGELQPYLDHLARTYVIDALLTLGWDFRVQELLELDTLMEALGILPSYQKLLQRLLDDLSHAGYLSQASRPSQISNQWRVEKPLSISCNAVDECHQDLIETRLLKQCGMQLAGVLNGCQDPLSLLFPDQQQGNQKVTSAGALYAQAEGFLLLNQVAVQAFKSWLQQMPTGRPLRILEVGAGTGGTSRHILPILQQRLMTERESLQQAELQFHYVYTDLSNAFFAQEQFQDYAFIDYQVLDISHDPLAQGFQPKQFDLVIAANVVHATPDLNVTLTHIHQLLHHNGALMLLEGLQEQLWVDLIFGLTEGWWNFTDQRQENNYPLLDQSGWEQRLEDNAFAAPVILEPQAKSSQLLCQQSVIISYAIKSKASETIPALGSYPPSALSHPAADWLILNDDKGRGKQFAEFLKARGEAYILVNWSREYFIADTQQIFVNPDHPEHFSQLLDDWDDNSGDGHKAILNLWPLNADISYYQTGSEELLNSEMLHHQFDPLHAALLHLAQAMAARPELELSLFRSITKGATGEQQSNPIMRSCWGLLRVIARELPQLHSRLLDIQSGETETEQDAQILETLPLELCYQPFAYSEEQSAFIDGRVVLPRLMPYALQTDTEQEVKPLICPNSSYVITGAFGGMGLKVAQWLLDQGAEQLILLARSKPSLEIQEWLDAQNHAGKNLQTLQLDVSDYSGLKQALIQQQQSGHVIKGIFHTAGVVADRLIPDYDWSLFKQVFPAKISGAWNLHCASLELNLPLQHFVLFSSTASLLGVSGLANYVTANAFLDGLAVCRQAQQLPATSIHWGIWENTGMASAVDDTRRQQWQVMGIETLQPQQAIQAMQSVLATEKIANIAIFDVNFQRYVNSLESIQAHPFFAELVELQPSSESSSQSETAIGIHIPELLTQDPQQQTLMMNEYVSEKVASVLGLQELDPRRGFFELGMDSLTSMELRNRLQVDLKCNLDSTLTFKYPNVVVLSEYLLENVIRPLAALDTEIKEDVTSDDKTEQDELVGQAETDWQESLPSEDEAEDRVDGEDMERLLDEQLADIDRLLAEEDEL